MNTHQPAEAHRAETELWLEATGETLPDSEQGAETMEEIFESEELIEVAQELHGLLQGSGDRHREAVTANNLGHVLCDVGRFAEAVGFLETAERLHAETGDHAWNARARAKLEEARRLVGS